MSISNSLKAQVLINALPYLQKYSNKIVVIKYGGNAMTNPELKNAVMSDIVLLTQVGIRVVLVHGGGPEVNDMLERLGIQTEFINGLRRTCEESISVVQMVLSGKVNKDLVMNIQKYDGRALGLCGIDGGIIKAVKQTGDNDLGYVGEVTSIDTTPILTALDNGYIPVIATVAAGEDGKVYNINADTAAAKIAVALEAENLILMTDIKGLLRNPKDESTLIPEVRLDEVQPLVESGVISGGMIPKIDCCIEAVEAGVGHTIIIDGRVPHSVLIEILSNEGVGTMFVK